MLLPFKAYSCVSLNYNILSVYAYPEDDKALGAVYDNQGMEI